MKIVSIVGTRPEFIQAAPLSRVLQREHHVISVHTGQHYDAQMYRAIVADLGMAEPDYDLGVGSGSHAQQTAGMLLRLEKVLLAEQPDLVIVRGDTNSTLAGALAASKLQVPIAHIEAGERSGNLEMPEEVNRAATDRLAQIHLCASRRAARNLDAEGITRNVHWVGDVMLDSILMNETVADRRSNILSTLNLKPRSYSLVTMHRVGNIEQPDRLRKFVHALNKVRETVIFPIHPRTADALANSYAHLEDHIRPILPLSYFDMIVLEKNARLIATDSGGVQREAYFLGIPCLTLREETEWIGTLEAGWNKLVGVEPEAILSEWWDFQPTHDRPPIYGEGKASHRAAKILGKFAERLLRPGSPNWVKGQVSTIQQEGLAE